MECPQFHIRGPESRELMSGRAEYWKHSSECPSSGNLRSATPMPFIHDYSSMYVCIYVYVYVCVL